MIIEPKIMENISGFLYLLLNDNMLAGKVEELLKKAKSGTVVYDNKFLGQYANILASELVEEYDAEREWFEKENPITIDADFNPKPLNHRKVTIDQLDERLIATAENNEISGVSIKSNDTAAEIAIKAVKKMVDRGEYTQEQGDSMEKEILFFSEGETK